MGEGNVSVAGRWIRHVTGATTVFVESRRSVRPSARPPVRPSVCLSRSGSNTRSVFLCSGGQFPVADCLPPCIAELGSSFFLSQKRICIAHLGRIWCGPSFLLQAIQNPSFKWRSVFSGFRILGSCLSFFLGEYCEHVNEHSGTNAICPSELCGSVVDAVPVLPSTPAAHYSSCTRSISTSSGADSSSGTVTGSCCLRYSSSSAAAAAAGVPTSPATAPPAASNVLAGSNARD